MHNIYYLYIGLSGEHRCPLGYLFYDKLGIYGSCYNMGCIANIEIVKDSNHDYSDTIVVKRLFNDMARVFFSFRFTDLIF